MSRTTYEVRVDVNGVWKVTYGTYPYVAQHNIASGSESGQREGELAARCAIEDHKATVAKQQVKASMARKFTVKS